MIETPELIDQDGSEKLSNITIDVPNNAIFSAGTNNGDGTWTLTFDQLTHLFVKPEPNVGDDFTLKVSVQSEETENVDFKVTQQTILVDVIPVADIPVLTVQEQVSGNEDAVIPLIIHQPELVDQDGSESLSNLTISGVPEQAILSSGIKNEDNWIVQPGELENLTITPEQNSSNNMVLSVSVDAQESENQSTATATQMITLNVIPVADAPMLSVVEFANGDEDTAIPLSIEHPILVDNDGSEELVSMIISQVPLGATLSAGTYIANDNPHWSVPLEKLNQLTITPPEHDADNFTIDISAISIEKENQDQAVTSQHITIAVNPVADMPILRVENTAYGNEDTNIPIVIEQVELVDTDGSEKFDQMIIEGVPDNAILSAGLNNGNGTWTLPISELSDLFVRLIPNVAQSFNLNLSLIAVEIENNDFKTTHQTIAVDVIPVADAPILDVENTATGNEDTAIAIVINQLKLKDLDGSEILGEIIFFGIPDQATLSNGKKVGADWILTHEELSNLTLTPALHDAGDFFISVCASAIEIENQDSEHSDDFIYVDVIPVADPPQLAVQNQASGKEKTDIPIYISPPQLIDMDGSEFLSNVFISGPTDNIQFSSGVNNGNGSWEFSLEQLNNLAVQLDVDKTSDITLEVYVYATEFENNDTVAIQQEFIVNVVNSEIYGDVNADTLIDLKDAIIVLSILTEIDTANITINADVNNDGQIGLPEAQYILKILANIQQFGDIDANGVIDLKDVMIAFQILAGNQIQGINDYGQISMAEVWYVLEILANIPKLEDGDIDANGIVDLKDVMIALEILAGEQLQGINNHGGKIDLVKMLFILNLVALDQ
ncbi:MAG: hypothetical protein OMM_06825 [Candidatus Magnetoglobus multicellularis str. Araruama]|uniref:Dockerin domain-containing protein n=1 Tax=Candidatus Magnetoglobus multicellularis str. Araruama TaxID=890399 RepID=A0A1V1PFG2_9BACT|nr:MAG: hypothetical protein OMM_06825 [Candidatus Magnetoglobus multicellularis str. Araruama]